MANYPALRIDVSSTVARDIKRTEVAFDDNYIQTTPLGLNPVRRIFTVVHRFLNQSDANTLRAFLDTNYNTVIQFSNIIEDPSSPEAVNVKIRSYQPIRRSGGVLTDMTVILEEYFGP